MKINSVELVISATRRSQYPTDNKPEFLLVGRSNVGKSSFINTIIGRKNYARTSATPGKTQTINFYLVNNEFYLVDAPGYGYASLNKTKQRKFGLMMEDYLTSRKNLKTRMALSITKQIFKNTTKIQQMQTEQPPSAKTRGFLTSLNVRKHMFNPTKTEQPSSKQVLLSLSGLQQVEPAVSLP